jgi:uncharacterized protein (TIGR03435 family)
MKTSLVRGLIICAMAVGVALTHTSAAQETARSLSPTFDVVSIRRYSVPQTETNVMTRGRRVGCMYSSDRVQCASTVQELVADAFSLKINQVRGPLSMNGEAFTVSATMPPETSRNTAKLMLQNALVERFGLKYHFDTPRTLVYAMVATEHGLKLQLASSLEQREKERIVVHQLGGMRAATMIAPGHLFSDAMSLDSLAQNIEFQLNFPVVNATALNDLYKIDL